mgnify:CR=1 FL=1
MDFELPVDDDPRRLAVRAWLSAHPDPTPVELADAGYSAPHWPRPWGLDADAEHQLIINEELDRAGIGPVDNQIGIGWAGPTLVHAGTQEQKDRYLFPLLAAEEIWCQLFSEPDAGSDLASLGTRAVRDGDEWIVNGSKIWNSGAQNSQFGILIARTDPDAAPHAGLSEFIVDLHSPGVEIRTIHDMSDDRHFCEVHFSDVRVPADLQVGTLNGAFKQIMRQMEHERGGIDRGVRIGLGAAGRERAGRRRALRRSAPPGARDHGHRTREAVIASASGEAVITGVLASCVDEAVFPKALVFVPSVAVPR